MVNKAAARMWDEYASATDATGEYTAWSFGGDDDARLADELAELVLVGHKRATAGLLAEYRNEGEALPEVGDRSVILDGSGSPVCVIRTTWVDVRPFGEVDENFARDEGEGNRTLQWWRQAHIQFFGLLGYEVDEDSEMVLERFQVVWPVVRNGFEVP